MTERWSSKNEFHWHKLLVTFFEITATTTAPLLYTTPDHNSIRQHVEKTLLVIMTTFKEVMQNTFQKFIETSIISKLPYNSEGNLKTLTILISINNQFTTNLKNKILEAFFGPDGQNKTNVLACMGLRKLNLFFFCADLPTHEDVYLRNGLNTRNEEITKEFHHTKTDLKIQNIDNSFGKSKMLSSSDAQQGIPSAEKAHLLFGKTNGPSCVFYMTLLHIFSNPNLSKFSRTLFLETDTIFPNHFYMSHLDAFVNAYESQQWFIIGARYTGSASIPTIFENHINGVAFYNTGSHFFRKFLTDIWIPYHANISLRLSIPHDCVLSSLFYEILNNASKLKTVAANMTKRTIRKINNFLIYCPLIVNLSPWVDSRLTIPQIIKENPSAVLIHSKCNYWKK